MLVTPKPIASEIKKHRQSIQEYCTSEIVSFCTKRIFWVYDLFITARKRSLGQGNIFTPVCHSVHRGVLSQHALQVVSPHALQGSAIPTCIAGGIPACLAGRCYPNMHCRWYPSMPCRGVRCKGGLVPGGLLPGVAWWRPPRWLLLQAVCILLECILV